MNVFVLFKVISQVIELIGFEKDVFELVSLQSLFQVNFMP